MIKTRRLLFVFIALAFLAPGAPTARATPSGPAFGPVIDAYQAYAGQSTCDPTAKAGVVDFKNLVLANYPGTESYGITRSCDQGGTSEHKEGRAWDWKVNANDPAQAAQAQDLLDWLLAPDQYGNDHALLRRFGLMYVIWNRRILKAYDIAAGWQTYNGASSHTDHVHFSFGWPGALEQTTWWNPAVSMLASDGGPGSRIDFNADRRQDVSVFRPSTGQWFVRGIADGGVAYGSPGDAEAANAWNLDGNTKLTVFRRGTWYVQAVADGGTSFGAPGDTPVPANWSGDWRAELAVFRAGRWFVSVVLPGGLSYGSPGDIPVPGQWGLDETFDFAVFRPSTSRWFLRGIADAGIPFGSPGDVPVPMDYNLDGTFDCAVFRPSNGTWYIRGVNQSGTRFGAPGDVPVPGDYDGNGSVDLAVFRPSNGTWYIKGVAPGGIRYGVPGDVPVRVFA